MLDDLTLYEHLEQARILIHKYATASQDYLHDDEDCVSYVATAMMQAYESYDKSKGAKMFTWVTTKGKFALMSFSRDYRRALEPAYRHLDDGSKRLSNIDWWEYLKEDRDADNSHIDMGTIVAMTNELLQFHLLTPVVRMYMELHYICGWTGVEIARVLGLNHNNVKQQIINGRKRLIDFAITDEMKKRFENCYMEQL